MKYTPGVLPPLCMGRHIENTFPIATGLTQIRLPSRISFVRGLQLDAMELISNVLRFHLNELFYPKGGSWLVLRRGREEECGNEVPCRGRGLGAGWQNGFERGATGLTVVQQTWLVAVCNCKKS